jgi:GNAT superfamily N-acetyltransferase
LGLTEPVDVTVREMVGADVEGASTVQIAAFEALDRSAGIEARPVTDAVWARLRVRHEHFLTHDPAGSCVATADERVVGCALALRRDSLWGLSLLVVDPEGQSSGIGRRLLDASLTYAQGCDRAIILSSQDPRAMRAYATSGFALFPQVEAHGEPDRAALPALNGRVRDGSLADVELADEVDRDVRGARRGPDHVRMASDMPIFVADDVDGRGYAYLRTDGEIFALAATDDETATALLWRCLAHSNDIGVAVTVNHLNSGQQWAIRSSYDARLMVRPAGPVFWRGSTPPAAFLPCGAYL